jgi:hypothetical protein
MTLLSLPEKDELGGVCSTNGRKRTEHMVLVGRLERKRSLGRSRCNWVAMY